MASPITGLASYNPSGGSPVLAACKGTSFWTWDGTTQTQRTSSAIDATEPCVMVQANDILYGLDGTGTIFKWDAATFSLPTILDASGTALDGVTDMVWFRNRMWYAKGDYIHYSDVGFPELITGAALRPRRGGGATIIKLVTYRNALILAFLRGADGHSSIQVVDVSAIAPTYYTIEPLFEGANLHLMAPQAIIRVGFDADSDIVYPTREGMRTLGFTSLDALTSPTLPITQNVIGYLDDSNTEQMERSFAVVFNDELFWWIVPKGELRPTICLAKSLTIPRESVLQGYVKLDSMAASSAAIISFAGEKPKLYFGGNDGAIHEAFSAFETDTTYDENSKRLDFGQPNQDKFLLKLIGNFDRGSSGAVTPRVTKEDGSVYYLESRSINAGGLLLPAQLPALLGGTGISTETWDLRYDANHNQLPRFQDVRVGLRSTGNPRILGYDLQATIEPRRFTPLDSEQGAANSAASVGGDTITAGSVSMD